MPLGDKAVQGEGNVQEKVLKEKMFSLRPATPVPAEEAAVKMKDWEQSALYKWLAREHLIELLNSKKVELIDDERIPELPEAERSLSVKQRQRLSFNPQGLPHFSEIECQYATTLYKKQPSAAEYTGPASQIAEDHQKTTNTIELLVAHMV